MPHDTRKPSRCSTDPRDGPPDRACALMGPELSAGRGAQGGRDCRAQGPAPALSPGSCSPLAGAGPCRPQGLAQVTPSPVPAGRPPLLPLSTGLSQDRSMVRLTHSDPRKPPGHPSLDGGPKVGHRQETAGQRPGPDHGSRLSLLTAPESCTRAQVAESTALKENDRHQTPPHPACARPSWQLSQAVQKRQTPFPADRPPAPEPSLLTPSCPKSPEPRHTLPQRLAPFSPGSLCGSTHLPPRGAGGGEKATLSILSTGPCL